MSRQSRRLSGIQPEDNKKELLNLTTLTIAQRLELETAQSNVVLQYVEASRNAKKMFLICLLLSMSGY